MNIRKIYKKLNLEIRLEEEINRFNTRLVNAIREIEDLLDDLFILENLINEFSFNLGEPGYESLIDYFFTSLGNEQEKLLNRNIFKYNVLLETLQQLVNEAQKTTSKDHYELALDQLLYRINQAFELSMIDIGYSISGNLIVKSQAKELDEELLSSNLIWLNKFSVARKLYEQALKHYLTKKKIDLRIKIRFLRKTGLMNYIIILVLLNTMFYHPKKNMKFIKNYYQKLN